MTFYKSFLLVGLLLILEIVIGFLQEIMPDGIKDKFKIFCQDLNVQPEVFWWILMGCTTLLILYLAYKKEETSPPTTSKPVASVEITNSKNVNTGKVNTGGGNFKLGDN